MKMHDANEDARITIRETAEALDISSWSVSNILQDKLRCRKVSVRWISHILTQEIKRDRVAYSKSLLQSDDNCDPRRLHEVVTGDETWVHHYEPERTAQSRAWVPKGGNPP